MPDADDPDAVRSWARRLGESLGWTESSLKLPSRVEAEADGWSGSRRAFVRRWKVLHHLDDKGTPAGALRAAALVPQADRGGLVGQIEFDEVRRDVDAASFCAYFVPCTNVRRGFSLRGRRTRWTRSPGLLDRLGRNADWWMVARCHSSEQVVGHLTDEQRGALLIQWWSQMLVAGERLGDLNQEVVPVDRAGMIVRRGMDSATWNLSAQAFNKARDGWFAVVDVIGQFALLDLLCPPKVMRLMAADLAAWRRSVGRDTIAPDVKVAAQGLRVSGKPVKPDWLIWWTGWVRWDS